jgi:hypothetical protein
LFQTAKNLGELDEDNASELWNEIPGFDAIPAYISGLLYKNDVNLPIQSMTCELKGRKKKRICISAGVGLFSPETVRAQKDVQQLDPDGVLPIAIDPIIDSLSGQHFFANSGALRWTKNEWECLLKKM